MLNQHYDLLVLCEYSGIVRNAFAATGLKVLSLDLLPTESPGLHIQTSIFHALPFLSYKAIIAFPPCTYLASCQMFRLKKDPCRKLKSDLAMQFVQQIYNLPCPLIAIENPIGRLNTNWKRPSQITCPSHHGSPYSKDICLWLKGFPPLLSSGYTMGKKKVVNHVNSRMTNEQRSKIKSKFFPEVAASMALQWANIIKHH